MHRFSNIQVKHVIALGLIGLLLYMIVSSINIYDSVFTGPTQEPKMSEWESYFESRQKRNARAMKLSYEDLMMIGHELLEEEDFKEAIEAFKLAKSIYPEAMDPRIQLCYIYLQLCQSNTNACNYGKREIYYAMQHLDGADHASKAYLDKLVDHTDLTELIALEEGVAMSKIF